MGYEEEAHLGLASFSGQSLCKDEEFSGVCEELEDRNKKWSWREDRVRRRKGARRGTKLIPRARNRQQKSGDKAWQHCFT